MNEPARAGGAPSRWPLLLALCAGALLPLAFAPFNLWPLAIVSPALQMWLWSGVAPRRAALLGYCYGAGTFIEGTWWLYISIHGFGGAPVWLSVVLILLLVALMASYQALLGWCVARYLPQRGAWRWYAGLPAMWLLTEWLRGWLISGFPWLSLGYSQTDTILAGYAPLLGVYGVSALLLVQSGALLAFLQARGRERFVALTVVVLVWVGGAVLGRFEWTRAAAAPVAVAIVQGAIPQDEKWQVDNLEPTKALYRQLNGQTAGARLVVWPEAAVPELANEIVPYLADIQGSSRARGADVLMGAVRLGDNGEDEYLSLIHI